MQKWMKRHGYRNCPIWFKGWTVGDMPDGKYNWTFLFCLLSKKNKNKCVFWISFLSFGGRNKSFNETYLSQNWQYFSSCLLSSNWLVAFHSYFQLFHFFPYFFSTTFRLPYLVDIVAQVCVYFYHESRIITLHFDSISKYKFV